MESDADLRHVVKTMLTSDFFKEARMKRVKSPTNFVANVLKVSGDYRDVDVGLGDFPRDARRDGSDTDGPAIS